jgi:4-hydroxybenzoate polyprenyltransferase
LARPRLWPFVLALPLLGYGWAHWDRALSLRGVRELGWVLAAWTLLHIGTMWLNAVLDQDEGEVLLGEVAVPPDGMARAAHVVLVGCVAAAWVAGPGAFWAALLAVGLSEAYSHPRWAWKGHPVGGPLVNVVGYGVLSPWVGWWAVGVAPNPRTLTVAMAVAAGVLGVYLAAQAFQEEDDKARGYRTMVALWGPAGVLRAARVVFAVPFLVLLLLAVAGWLPRETLLVVPTGLWIDAWLARWSRQEGGGDAGWAVELAWRLGASTALVVCTVAWAHLDAITDGRPVAGLGTVAGHPADRPLLPPLEMLAWEHGLYAPSEGLQSR